MTGNGKPANGMAVIVHHESFCVRNEESNIYGKITGHRIETVPEKENGKGHHTGPNVGDGRSRGMAPWKFTKLSMEFGSILPQRKTKP